MSELEMILGPIRGIPDFIRCDPFSQRELAQLAEELSACRRVVLGRLMRLQSVEGWMDARQALADFYDGYERDRPPPDHPEDCGGAP